MPPPLQPDEKLTIVLTAAEWNVVLAQLGEGPYRIVAPLLQKITAQGMAHPRSEQPFNGLAQEEALYVPDR
jgi:hypothetical protein